MDHQIAEIRRMIAAGALDEALDRLTGQFFQLGNQATCMGRIAPLPDFDLLCQELGEYSGFQLFGPKIENEPRVHDVILLTEITCNGGHAEIVRDIAALNDVPVAIIATNLHNRPKPLLKAAVPKSNVLEVAVAKEQTASSKLREVQTLLARSGVRRVFLLQHGYDAIATSAICGDLPSRTIFLHHCDAAPSLGSYLPGVIHVDLHNIAHARCRIEGGITDNRYLCLTSLANTVIHPTGRRFAFPSMKSASCGGEHKLERLAYGIGYSDMVATVLKGRDAQHYHIGSLSGDFRGALAQVLSHHGIPETRFIYVGEAPGLADVLTSLEIDLYLPTLPQGGGKAMIDAMSRGIPIVVHENARDRLWGGRDLVYPEAPSWRTLDELDTIIADFDEATWRSQSEAASRYFTAYHAPDLFRRQLALSASDEHAPPPLKPYRPAPTQYIWWLTPRS